MFIDASAVVAILKREPGHEELIKRIAISEKQPLVSPLVRFEAIAGLASAYAPKNHKPTVEQVELAAVAVDALLAELRAKSVMISDTIGAAAVDAARTYGKLVGHPADLNFGDCFAYACAKGYHAPLLYKGNDFANTDLG